MRTLVFLCYFLAWDCVFHVVGTFFACVSGGGLLGRGGNAFKPCVIGVV